MSGWKDREDFENERASRSDALFREALGLGVLHTESCGFTLYGPPARCTCPRTAPGPVFDPVTYDPPNPDPSYACGLRATCEADSAEIADLRRALEEAEKALQALTDQRDEAIGEAQQHAEDYIVLLDRYATLRAAMVDGVIEAGRRYFLGYITHEQYVAEIDAAIPVKP